MNSIDLIEVAKEPLIAPVTYVMLGGTSGGFGRHVAKVGRLRVIRLAVGGQQYPCPRF
jgi:hypothetical protein